MPDFIDNSFSLWFPEINVTENEKDKTFVVIANVPGIKKENIYIKVEKNVLTIGGEEKQDREEKSDNAYFAASTHSSFSQSIPLPENIDIKNIKTGHSNGILTLTIYKTKKVISAHKK